MSPRTARTAAAATLAGAAVLGLLLGEDLGESRGGVDDGGGGKAVRPLKGEHGVGSRAVECIAGGQAQPRPERLDARAFRAEGERRARGPGRRRRHDPKHGH